MSKKEEIIKRLLSPTLVQFAFFCEGLKVPPKERREQLSDLESKLRSDVSNKTLAELRKEEEGMKAEAEAVGVEIEILLKQGRLKFLAK